MVLSWLTVALGAIGLLLSSDTVSAQAGTRQPASPSYRGRDACPLRCSIAGPNPANWGLYRSFDQFQTCKQTLFYDFSIYDQVDDPTTHHRIYACTTYGTDWLNQPQSYTNVARAESVNATYEIGWRFDGKPAGSDIQSLSKQMRQYLENGYGGTNKTVLLFAHSGRASAGLYIGKGLQSESTASFALKALEDSISILELNTGSLAMQLCDPGSDGDHIFGFMATSNGRFTPVQDALKSWSNAECLSFQGSQNVTGPAFFNIPFAPANNKTSPVGHNNLTSSAKFKRSWPQHLSPRGACRTLQVVSGDSCASLTKKCGISGADFIKYNLNADLCSTLMPQQHVCCSPGTIPDFAPKPNPDGSCATYTVQNNDNCAGLAAANSITVDQLEAFNSETWGWSGCSNIWVGTVICLSSGTAPMPAPLANAMCGPQVPGTAAPTDGTDIASLNPCPLNACCDAWGQCGTTGEFCTNTSTGAPGTAKPGTNGCISNCGTEVVSSDPPEIYRSVAYFEGYNLDRSCLYQEALQIDGSKYTHLHFAFGTITPDYEIKVGNRLSSFEFDNFKRIGEPAKILSLGGWEFSTSPHTYGIFREGVTPANRQALATSIANFIKDHDLGGVDIDWEYPGAPDIPNVPPGNKDDGQSYLAFLKILKSLLPGKSVSIAAPSSYWYLKNFPIKEISQVVDYIVFMTYDLHGQWDANNQYAQDGCPSGRCLRSDVNMTETMNSLAMITKAGVPSNKVVVGVTSYGRSFAMAEAGCFTPDCFFTGTAAQSNAAEGPCTRQAGYLANAEIMGIISDTSRVNQNYVDQTSNTNILVYDNTQWVGWMSPQVKVSRQAAYKSLNMGGTTNWASDLETFHDPPSHSTSWPQFLYSVSSGLDPYQIGTRTGNWTELTCTDPAVEDIRFLTASQRWNMLDCSSAWMDAVNVWKNYDRSHNALTFTQSISATIHGPQMADCGSLTDFNNCDSTLQCDGFIGSGSGAAGYEIWNSMVIVHEMYSSFNEALVNAASLAIDPSLEDFENKFAPTLKPDYNEKWLHFLLNLVTLGVVMITAPYFNSYVSKMPYFLKHTATRDNLKDTAIALTWTTSASVKDMWDTSAYSPLTWTPEAQDHFSAYLGQVMSGWSAATDQALGRLFNGKDPSVRKLTSIISDGKFIQGDGAEPISKPPLETLTSMEASIAKSFFAFAIPAIWHVSGQFPFVIDSGYDCGTVDPLGTFLSAETMHATAGCYQGKLYYLASLKGAAQSCPTSVCIAGCSTMCSANKFSAPSGLEWLDGKSFGGVTRSDIIIGSVRTYMQNGNANGGGPADPANSGTLNDLFNQDVTTPGYIRLPVCSPDIAFMAWNEVGGPQTNATNYPCHIPLGISECGSSTFVGQTSEGSPTVADCQQLVRNIEGTHGNWPVENALGDQHQIAQYGSCKFGVQGIGKYGNIVFHVGGQDIVDLVNESIQKFSWNGLVGAKGEMTCRGDVSGQTVEWGLY